MKLTFISFLIFFILNFQSLFGQNLVNNPSFEKSNKNEFPLDWEIICGTPDIYNKLAKNKYFEETRYKTTFGNVFLGLMLFTDNTSEIIATKLIKKLEQGEIYLIKIFVAKPFSYCPSGIKKATLAFTNNQLPKH